MTDQRTHNVKQYSWVLAAIFCTMLWGSASPMIKMGYQYFQMDTSNVFNIILFAGVRFFGAGLLTLLISRPLTGEKPSFNKAMTGPVLVLALTQTAGQYISFYLGLAVVTGSVGAILSATNIFFTVIIATIFMRSEKLTTQKILATLLALVGIIVLNLDSNLNFAFRLNGEGFVLLSALANAFASIFMSRFSQKHNPISLTAYQFILGGAGLMLVGFFGGGRLNAPGYQGILVLAYLMVLSALAYGIWSLLLKHHPTSHVVIFHALVPVWGSLFSWLFMGDQIWNWQTLVALLSIVIGIFLVNKQKEKLTAEDPA